MQVLYFASKLFSHSSCCFPIFVFSSWNHAEVSMRWRALEKRNSEAEKEKLLEALFLKAKNQVPETQLNIDATGCHVHSILINHSTKELMRYTCGPQGTTSQVSRHQAAWLEDV